MTVQSGRSAPHPAALAFLTAQWCMEPTAYARLTQRLLQIPSSADLRAFWDDEEDDLPAVAVEKPKEKKPYQTVGGIALLPLTGILVKRDSWLTRYFSGEFTSTEAFIGNVAAASADPDVSGIVVKTDSPGGMADGNSEAGAAVYAVRQAGKKPILAVATGQCCSAAYWIACQASELWAGDDDWIGSIGTRYELVDTSKLYEEMGIEAKVYASGTFKAAGANGVPFTPEVDAYIQGLVDRSQDQFTAAVARGRKLPIDDVRKIAKEARIYIGKDAEAVGLIDGIATLQETLTRLQKSGAPAGKPAARSGTQEKPQMNLWEQLRASLGGAEEAPNAGAATQPGAAPAAEGTPAPAASQAPAPPAVPQVSEPERALLAACREQGVTTAEQMKALAGYRERYVSRLRVEAKRVATIATGRDMAATVDAMGEPSQLEAFITDMGGQADGRFGITEARGGTRKTEPADPATTEQQGGPAASPERVQHLIGLANAAGSNGNGG
jgi:signal peptide peptidase SppA